MRRSGSNNLLDLMRSMLRFLDDRLEAVGLGVHVGAHPGGVFMTRLRNRLASLIGARTEANTSGSTGNAREHSERIRNNRRASRRGAMRQGASAIEERRVVNMCNRVMSEAEERNHVGTHPGESPEQVVTTSLVVTDSDSASVAPQTAQTSNTSSGRTLRVMFPRTPSQELRLLFFSSQGNDRPRENVIYEIQINFDVLDVSSDAPVTATKESMKKSEVLRAKIADESCECAVCMNNFVRSQKLRMLPCEHKFHTKCVDKWLLECSNRCPVCRVGI